ncbi:tRNA N6-adenosine threonylcarbamoyltransferase [Alphaproteobacteria bacterium]|nr:tRNA N6-adenosine threonylcarbamoyltransferase [Alphaproteobacteria bacterium]
MRVLGIESSCDETAAAVVEDGRRILSNVVISQIDIHKVFGGVVPEVAARSHIEAILPVVDEAVQKVGGWDAIDAIAVTTHPGLIGSLMIGTLTARTLALVKNKPLYPIDHIEAHVYANFLEVDVKSGSSSGCLGPVSDSSPTNFSNKSKNLVGDPLLRATQTALSGSPDFTPSFPILALIVSGGHTEITLFHDHGDYRVLGATRDDAVGEAFDKVAKILGLPYPGGPSISDAAMRGNPDRYKLPKAKLKPNRHSGLVPESKYNGRLDPETSSGRPFGVIPDLIRNPEMVNGPRTKSGAAAYGLDFSFSGLKTAVLRAVQAECGKTYDFPSNGLSALLDDQQRNDFAASFQKTAVETLVDNVKKAYAEYRPKSVVVAGGVAANNELRRQLAERLPITPHFPAPEFCTDNAAMVAGLGYFEAQKTAPTDPLNVHISPN